MTTTQNTNLKCFYCAKTYSQQWRADKWMTKHVLDYHGAKPKIVNPMVTTTDILGSIFLENGLVEIIEGYRIFDVWECKVEEPQNLRFCNFWYVEVGAYAEREILEQELTCHRYQWVTVEDNIITFEAEDDFDDFICNVRSGAMEHDIHIVRIGAR